MNKPLIIVTGKNGQLGRELQDLSTQDDQLKFKFFSKDELNIADDENLRKIFNQYKPAYFINCAAYTAVDKAETDNENAYEINAEAVGNIASLCKEYNSGFIHISTDYVYEGTASEPYKETDPAKPVNYYGYTKWKGEQFALEKNPATIIIRTSWVYSTYGNNFVKTMLRLMNEKNEINVVNDQKGSPTYAKDLAEAVLLIIIKQTTNSQLPTANYSSGIYNFSNEGVITWYDFACEIKNIKKLSCKINPIPTSAFPTPATRPAYSVMNKEKIKQVFDIDLKNWKDSLEICLSKL